MFLIIVGLGGVSTGLTSRLHCLLRVSRLGTPLRISLDLVAITGVWLVLLFCFASGFPLRCPGSRVMYKYGVFVSVSGGVTTLGSVAGTGWTGMGSGASVDCS